ncbi:putative D-serine dehydratase-like domain-containing protein [Seiridium cardinale]|uniref:D-serine dehydratase-like domain-containing protein n=1 Tax=Seiridium cardinale TaxID=138064 RepID=A0ABR2XBF8_9PEZI
MAAHASKDLLRAQFVGKGLYQVATPAAVLDLAKVEANCNLMLDAAQRLNLSWRAHIKTHKTIELTRLQVGDQAATPVNIVVFTLAEAENVVPLLKEYQQRTRQVNCVDRLAAISAQLGPNGLTVMVDHSDQLKYLTSLASKSGHPPPVFLKINVGNDRAGVVAGSAYCSRLIVVRNPRRLGGIGISRARAQLFTIYAIRKERPHHPLVLSAGATPTVSCLQHPSFAETDPQSTGPNVDTITDKLSNLIQDLRRNNFVLEVHAGVHPTLDLQQLAAHSRDSRLLSPAAIAISALVEVCSLYPGRGPNGTTEALINAGTLALAREPCVDKGNPPGQHLNN